MERLKFVNKILKKYGFETFGTGKLDIDKWPEEVFDAIAGGDEDSESMTVRKKEIISIGPILNSMV